MKLTLGSFDDTTLAQLGVEAARFLSTGDLHALLAQFGYALTFDREPIKALTEDVAAVLAEVGASAFGDARPSSAKVSHFEPNDTGASSLVECLLPADNGKHVLVELVLTTSGSEAHVILEQISAAS